MAIFPTPAVAVVPVLALYQARISRTHRALLSTVFVLNHRHRYTDPWEALPPLRVGRHGAGGNGSSREVRAAIQVPWGAALALRVIPARPVHPRPVADQLWVERLATGAILGTQLDLACRDETLVRAAAGDAVLDIEA